jgi:hypothetical protein
MNTGECNIDEYLMMTQRVETCKKRMYGLSILLVVE